MYRPWAEVEAAARADLERRVVVLAERVQLELGATLVHEPRLFLQVVILQRQRLASTDEQDLPAVAVGQSPDQLVTPGLLYTPRLEEAHATCSQSGCAATYSSARRRSFGVLIVIQTPSCRKACRRPAAASAGKVVDS